VTVVELLPNRITQVKTDERDGYRAVQVTYGESRPQLLSKAIAGHFAKSNVAPGKALIEFRLAKAEAPICSPARSSRWIDSAPARRSTSPE